MPAQCATYAVLCSTTATEADLRVEAADCSRLLELLSLVPDPRRARGVRHRLVGLLAVAAAAVLAGARSVLAIGEWAGEAPQSVLAALGARFSARHEVTISKPAGGVRRLRIGGVEDRVVERAVLGELDRVVDPLLSPWSFAYRRGLGVKDAVRAVVAARDAGHAWFVRADFDDCFDHIPRWPVLQRLREVVADEDLCVLVQALVNRPVAGAGRGPTGFGLHQGSALSPLLANLYLDAFDRAMIGRGHPVYRYADDFACPAVDRASAERVLELADMEARAIQLRLGSDKSRVVSVDEGVPFCGQVITVTSGAAREQQAHPLQGTVFVTTEGALVRARGERLRVEHGDELLANIDLKRVRQVVCVGRVGVTSALVHRAVQRDIDLAWVYDDGRYAGRLAPLRGGDAQVRMDQYAAAGDERRALAVARAMVAGKIANMRVGLLRAARGQQQPELASHSTRLGDGRQRALGAGSRAELMGHEGSASRDYFDGLGRILGPEWGFTTRQRRPPPDPVNAMLSFGYTLLTAEAIAACELANLDPHLGMLHTVRRGRPSLALDLIEELRPVVVDATVVRVARSGQITPADFIITEDGCRLSDPARRSFVGAYEQRMLTLVHHPAEGRRISWRQAMSVQARQLAALFAGGLPDYRPVVWR